VTPPAIYSDFVQSFRWSILAYALPWSHPAVVRPSRELLTFEDHGRILDAYFSEIFLGTAFWLAVVFAAVMVLFLVMIAVSFVIDNKNFQTMARTRLIYSGLRILMFGYLGVACTAFYTLIFHTDPNDNGPNAMQGVIVAAIVLVVFVIGLPLFTFGILFNKKKELFILHFSMKFGCLFQSFHFKKSFFSTVHLGKKLLVAIWVGLLYNYPVPQLVLLAITHFAYFVGLIVLKPYIDHIHFFIDLAVSFLDVVMICVLSGFLHSTNTAVSCAVVAVILHIITMCVIIAGFINSVFKMHQINSIAQFFRVISGKESLPDADAINSGSSKSVSAH